MMYLLPNYKPPPKTSFASLCASCANLSEVVIKPLKCVANERQAHFRRLLLLLRANAILLQGLRLEHSCIVSLVNLIRGEVCRINVGSQTRLKRRANATQAVKVDAAEEAVVLDFVGSATAETVLSVANHAVEVLVMCTCLALVVRY